MSASVLAAALLLLCVGAAGAAFLRARLALRLGSWMGTLACAIGAAASAALLRDGTIRTVRLAWSAPINEVAVGVDPLSAFFLLCIFVVGGLGLLYAAGYFADAAAARPTGAAIAWLQILVVAMAGVVLARDVVVFLVAWEAMFLASYFLVTFDAHDPAVRRAGFTYLVASHLGVVVLFVLFGVLTRYAGSLRFADFVGVVPAGRPATLCFALALVGFGVKAGLWPLHGWLPEAHPAAPSPVSAVMSGVMLKMGIYGVLRALTFLGPPPIEWAIALLVVGAVSALAGVVLALAQRDLKRVLAYSSVENVGIIALGIGVGELGVATQQPVVAVAGFAGALLHTLNHGLFKGLLFQVAGVVVHATGSRDLEGQGGLLRRLPVTGSMALIGAVAIAGLPPLNGFVSELLIYLGVLRYGVAAPAYGAATAAVLVVPLLALVGGLATACFVRVFGIVFLGEPRSSASANAHEVGGAMRAAMALGAAACLAIGVLPIAVLRLVAAPTAQLAGVAAMPGIPAALGALSLVAALLLVAVLAVVQLRRWLLRRRAVAATVTWACGYAAPTPRMQYTATSFAQPVLDPFAGLLYARVQRRAVVGEFPQLATEEVQLHDPGEAAVQWTLGALVAPLSRVRVLQRGPVQLYLLYVLLTLLALLVWQVRS